MNTISWSHSTHFPLLLRLTLGNFSSSTWGAFLYSGKFFFFLFFQVSLTWKVLSLLKSSLKLRRTQLDVITYKMMFSRFDILFACHNFSVGSKILTWTLAGNFPASCLAIKGCSSHCVQQHRPGFVERLPLPLPNQRTWKRKVHRWAGLEVVVPAPWAVPPTCPRPWITPLTLTLEELRFSLCLQPT